MLPYYRLNLTRYLAGEITRDTLPIHPLQWYTEQNMDLRVGIGVVSLNRESKTLALSNGESLPYDKLILAMGSHPFVPPIPGSDLDGVITLRTAGDADRILKQDVGSGCIVIGGGILGIEAAGAVGRSGRRVTLIESHKWLMPRQLNERAASLLETHLGDLGVGVNKTARTREITGEDHVSGVMLDNGEHIEANQVILATGVRSNTYLARKAGLEVNRGVVVNNGLQTSDPCIFAAGDVAEHNGVVYGTWAPSQYQGSIAGLNAVGIPSEFGGLPRSNALKVLGVDLLSIGQVEPEDGSYMVLDQENDKRYGHFVFRDGRLVGSILMDYPGLGPTVKQAVEGKRDFSALLAKAQTGKEVLDYLES